MKTYKELYLVPSEELDRLRGDNPETRGKFVGHVNDMDVGQINFNQGDIIEVTQDARRESGERPRQQLQQQQQQQEHPERGEKEEESLLELSRKSGQPIPSHTATKTRQRKSAATLPPMEQRPLVAFGTDGAVPLAARQNHPAINIHTVPLLTAQQQAVSNQLRKEASAVRAQMEGDRDVHSSVQLPDTNPPQPVSGRTRARAAAAAEPPIAGAEALPPSVAAPISHSTPSRTRPDESFRALELDTEIFPSTPSASFRGRKPAGLRVQQQVEEFESGQKLPRDQSPYSPNKTIVEGPPPEEPEKPEKRGTRAGMKKAGLKPDTTGVQPQTRPGGTKRFKKEMAPPPLKNPPQKTQVGKKKKDEETGYGTQLMPPDESQYLAPQQSGRGRRRSFRALDILPRRRKRRHALRALNYPPLLYPPPMR